MSLSNYLTELGSFLTGTVGTGLFMNYLNKRKNKADADSAEIDNDIKIADKWREIAEKFEQRLNANEIAIEHLKKQHEECEHNTVVLQREIDKLKSMMP